MCLWIPDEWFTRLSRAHCGYGAALKVQLVLKAVPQSPYKSLLFSFVGSIVSVGDPKKKYTCFEKIGQGLVHPPLLSYAFPYVQKEVLKPVSVSLL